MPADRLKTSRLFSFSTNALHLTKSPLIWRTTTIYNAGLVLLKRGKTAKCADNIGMRFLNPEVGTALHNYAEKVRFAYFCCQKFLRLKVNETCIFLHKNL